MMKVALVLLLDVSNLSLMGDWFCKVVEPPWFVVIDSILIVGEVSGGILLLRSLEDC
jgi:hypothetical protein